MASQNTTAQKPPILFGSAGAPTTKRFSTVPSSNQFRVPTATVATSERWTTPSDFTRVAALPLSVSGGQYAQNPGWPNDLIKSVRGVSTWDRIQISKGLPGAAGQLDHIVPLDLGGVNAPGNYEYLLNADHNQKTAVGAVAQYLYRKNKISLGEARNIALNWRDKDITGIKVTAGALANPDIAEAKIAEWAMPAKIDAKAMLAGLRSFLPKFLGGKEPTTSAGKMAKEAIAEGPDNVIGQFGQGLASGLTMGYYPAEMKDPGMTGDNIAKIAGITAGSIASFMGFYGLVGKAAKAAMGINKVKQAAGAAKIPGWLNVLNRTESNIRAGKILLPQNVAYKALSNAGVFALYGQLSNQQEKTMADRTKMFFTDMAMGGLLGAAGRGAKSYATVGAGTAALLALNGANPAEVLANTAMMVGLHGIGGIGLEKRIDDAATKAAKKVFETYGVKESPDTMQMYNDAVTEIRSRLPIPTPESFKSVSNELKDVIVARRQLEKGGLGREARVIEDWNDMWSYSKRVNGMKPADAYNVPPILDNIHDQFGNLFAKATKVNSKNTGNNYNFFVNSDGATIAVPINDTHVITTGISSKIDPKASENLRTAKLRTGDYIVGVLRDEKPLVNYLAELNKTAAPENVYQNPRNNIEFYTIKDGIYKNVGWFPDANRISGRTNSINENLKKINLEYPSTKPLAEMDPTFNRNTASDKMRSEGMRFVVGQVVESGVAKGSGEPFLRLQIGPEHWDLSKTLNKNIKGNKSQMVMDLINSVKNRRAAEIQPRMTGTRASDNIKQIYGDKPSSDYLTSLFGAPGAGLEDRIKSDIDGAADLLSTLFTGRRKNFIKNYILQKGDNITVGDILGLIKGGKNNNTLTAQGEAMHEILMGETSFLSNIPRDDANIIAKMRLYSGPVETPKAQFLLPPPVTEKVVEVPKPTGVSEIYRPAMERDNAEFQAKLDSEQDIPAPNRVAEAIAKQAEQNAKVVMPKANKSYPRATTPVKSEWTGIRYVVKKAGASKTKAIVTRDLKTAAGKDTEKILDELGANRGEMPARKIIEENQQGWSYDEIEKARIIERLKKELPADIKKKYEQSDPNGEFVKEIDQQLKDKALVEMMTGDKEIYSTVYNAVRKGDMTMKQAFEAKNNLDKRVFDFLGINKNILATKSLDDFSNVVIENLKKSKGSNTYDEGIWTVLKEFLDMIPERKKWSMNSFFNPATAKGKKYLSSLSDEVVNREGLPERQPKTVLQETANQAQKEGSKWWQWDEKQKKTVYNPRLEELDKEAASRSYRKKPTAQKEGGDIMEEGGATLFGDIQAAGMRIRQNPDDFIQDINKIDNILRIKTASELPNLETNARGGAVDGVSLVINLIKSFNANPGKSGKIYIDFNKFSKIVDRFPVGKFPEKPIKIKTSQGVINAIKNHKAFVIPD